MTNKPVSLFDVVKLKDNPELSERYVSYLCGFKKEHKYRHDEVLAISSMINTVGFGVESANGFIFGYEIPQLNKEFDLLKVTPDQCLNIELKSHSVSQEKIKKQLLENKHFLTMLDIPLTLVSFDFETKTFFKLAESNELEIIDPTLMASLVVSLGKVAEIDLDDVFKPSNILVSPLNEPEKFYRHCYLLTEHQETIKNSILCSLDDTIDQRFFGLYGGPGTGKTLLLYDIAFDIARSGKSVLVVHSGIMCAGHKALDSKLDNLRIVEAKALRYRELRDYDVVAVDESQRIYISILDKIERWVNKARKKCIFSFDEAQKMSKSENRRDTPPLMKKLCTEKHLFKLTNKIRTNKEIALFITCLRDISKYRKEYSFKNVFILFEPDKTKAVAIAKESKKDGFQYISYTTSYFDSSLDYQESDFNTHRVIGQEFEGVAMVLNDRFYYDGNLLSAFSHPNSDYLYTQLLYQGLTRARTKLKLIIQTKNLLDKILILFEK